jgi:hypothetical protein
MNQATCKKDLRFKVVEVKFPNHPYAIHEMKPLMIRAGFRFIPAAVTWIIADTPANYQRGQELVAMFNQIAEEASI